MVVQKPKSVEINEEFAELYIDFLEFCNNQCDYGEHINDYASNINALYNQYREYRGLTALSSQTIGQMAKMAGLVRDGGRLYKIRKKFVWAA